MRGRPVVILAVAACGAVLLPSSGGAADAGAAVRAKALSWALTQVGTRERGTTNCSSKINRWQRDMRLRVPPCRVWCGAFVHQAYLRAGVRLHKRLIDPDRSYADAVAGRRHLRRIKISQIRPGDIVFYKFRKGVRASHQAIARTRPQGGRLRTIEGNTGHAVRTQTRGTRYIVLAARVTT